MLCAYTGIQCLFRRYSGVLQTMPVRYFSVQAISASFLVIRRVTSILRPQYRAFPENGSTVRPFPAEPVPFPFPIKRRFAS